MVEVSHDQADPHSDGYPLPNPNTPHVRWIIDPNSPPERPQLIQKWIFPDDDAEDDGEPVLPDDFDPEGLMGDHIDLTGSMSLPAL